MRKTFTIRLLSEVNLDILGKIEYKYIGGGGAEGEERHLKMFDSLNISSFNSFLYHREREREQKILRLFSVVIEY